ncbi:OTU domain-containing protein [Dorcoceras hygrometricum]|uniref:OTU domain-containing protein n=1 Tax=Dorcoceras hygrometricum TaxID=472368 RepID=A0A2Z7CNT2_9LAMI|nr:OTU domain-containing protein [Dorcoceras hygrometricum]
MSGSSSDGGRTAAAVASIACGAWPHAAAPSAATYLDSARQGWRTAGRPPRKIAPIDGTKLPSMLRNRLRGAAASGGRKSLAMASPSSRIHAMSVDQPWRNNCARLLAHWPASARQSCATIQQEHVIVMVQPSSSLSVADSGVGSSAVLAQFYSLAKSTCWVRPIILVNGVWTPIQGNDFWRSSCQLSLFVNRRQVPESVVDTDFDPHGFFIEPVQYWGAAPSLIKTCGWARVCIEIVRYSMFWCLRPGVYTDSFVGYFSGSDVESIAEIDLTSSDGSTVYRSPSPQVESSEEAESVEPIAHLALGPVISGVAQEEQSYFVEIPESPPPAFQHQETSILSSDSPVHFNSDDIPLDDTADVQTTFPAVTVDLSPLLDDLKISLSQHMDNAQSDILSRLHTIERGLRDTLGQQNEYFRNLIQSARQDGQNQDDIQTLRFNEFKKVVLAQGVTAGADSVEVRKEIKALDAKINSLDGQVVAIKSEQLEFQTKTAADLLSLSTQLGDIVDYIRGGDAKKGEGSSSRRPLPPSVNQGEGSGNRDSGDTVRTTDIPQRDIDTAQRNILERLMNADRERQMERERSRSGYHKKIRY